MDKRIKEEWLKALRSGDYKQTKGDLKNSDGFCCLGVLCDLHAKEMKGEWVTPGTIHRGALGSTELENIGDVSVYLGNSELLPYEVVLWADLKSESPSIPGDEEHTYDSELVELNDSYLTFLEIADLIEEHL